MNESPRRDLESLDSKDAVEIASAKFLGEFDAPTLLHGQGRTNFPETLLSRKKKEKNKRNFLEFGVNLCFIFPMMHVAVA